MQPFTVWGRIDSQGNRLGGQGFASRRESKGRYLITFDRPFAAPPTVVVTQSKDLRSMHIRWWDDNVITVDAAESDCLVAIRDVGRGGGYEDDGFNFVAIGEPAGS